MADKAKWTYEVLTKKRYYCRNTSDKTDESCGRMVIVISNISILRLLIIFSALSGEKIEMFPTFFPSLLEMRPLSCSIEVKIMFYKRNLRIFKTTEDNKIPTTAEA